MSKSTSPSPKKRFDKPSDIRVGVIGYGGAFNMGRAHLAGMKQAGMKPFAVCEIDPDRLKVAQQDFAGIETYDSLDAMLKQSDVNLIVHITPHNLHYSLAAKCLKAGKHVVTEKPFVITTAEADKLIALAQKHDRVVSTYHNRHWDGWIMRAVREVVDKGILGNIHSVKAQMDNYGMPKDWWRTSKSISGGVLYDWGVHLLEYGLQIIRDDMAEVSAFAHQGYWESQAGKNWKWKNDTNEDQASAIVRFVGGQQLEVSISQLASNPSPYQLEIYGEKGCYLISFKDGWTTRIANRKGELIEKTGKHPKGRGDLFYKNVAQYLCGNEQLVITPQWARRPIHVLDLAGKSIAKNAAIKVKYR